MPYRPGSARTVTPPDFIEYHEAPDGSVVRVTCRHWEGHGKRGVTFFIAQTWKDGERYEGACRVGSLEEALRLSLASPDAGERKWAARH